MHVYATARKPCLVKRKIIGVSVLKVREMETRACSQKNIYVDVPKIL